MLPTARVLPTVKKCGTKDLDSESPQKGRYEISKWKLVDTSTIGIF